MENLRIQINSCINKYLKDITNAYNRVATVMNLSIIYIGTGERCENNKR
jgi:hypothetical protein